MKKTIVFIMILVLTIILYGCGNMSIGLGNFEYEKVHVDTHNYSGCFSVVKWYENGTGIEVKTKENGSLFLSEGTYFLISNDCPFCDKPTKE